jgi:hypothetical protein
MKLQIIKLVALIALLMGGSSISAQNSKTSSAFAIDKNITSFAVDSLVDKKIIVHEIDQDLTITSITLIMADGADVTSLTPDITLASGAAITSRTVGAQDFYHQVTYTVAARDGTTSTYLFLAYNQNITRTPMIFAIQNGSNGYTDPGPGVYIWDTSLPYYCVSYPNSTYMIDTWTVNGYPISHSPNYTEYLLPDCILKATFKLIPPSISGSTTICSGSSYTFSASYAPAGFTWNKSSNLNLSGSGNSVSVSAVSGANGAGWVSINHGGSELARLNVWIGPINLTSSSVTGPSSATIGVYTSYGLNLPAGANPTGYQWSVNPTVSGKIIGANTDMAGIVFDNPGFYEVHCKVSNACGWGADNYAPVWVYNKKSYTVPYPNPASDVLNLSFDPEMVEATRTSLQASGFTRQSFLLSIKLLDNFGTVCRQITSTGETIQLDVSNLNKGMYYLQVHDGITPAPEVHKIIINR